LTLSGLIAALLVSAACTDTEVIFKERPLFEDPPAGAEGFLGYSESSSKLTVCGNCHTGAQGQWAMSAHADAWAGLQESGHAQGFCEDCHTVGPLGNPVDDGGGWASTGDPRYHDVQCESCHGPGETHVGEPGSMQPLAAISLGEGADQACGECHSGSHHPFADEWAQSAHAEPWGEFFPGGVDQGAAAALRPECQACHEGKGALRAWGVEPSYAEAGSDEVHPVTCAVCHDPHGSPNEGQLRFAVNTPSIEEHLCARCHNRTTNPNPASSHGLEPHSPEAALLVGEAGWFPPGAEIGQGQIAGTHGSEANPRLCATCHVAQFEVTDEETGEFQFSATGHLFAAIPCVDDQGIPTAGDCEVTTTARSFQSCTASGCHGSQQAASSALQVASNRLQDRADQLLSQLEQVDPGLDESGGEIDPSDPTFTVAEGAFFNYHLAVFGGSTRGGAAHNPFLTEALLVASIQAVEQEYGVSPSLGPALDWDAEMERITSHTALDR
jgi:predicted CXXCH cytochrome family protein